MRFDGGRQLDTVVGLVKSGELPHRLYMSSASDVYHSPSSIYVARLFGSFCLISALAINALTEAALHRI